MFNRYPLVMKGFVLLSTLLISLSALGDGVILVTKGDNDIFTNASHSSKGQPPRVFFQGMHYTAVKAKIGLKVKSGDIVKTENKGQVRLGFITGDSINVGPASALVLDLSHLNKNKSKDKSGLAPTLNLIYGKFRAVISKKSPMKNTQIKTRAATAGVRGTDFYVAYNPSEGDMLTTVFRGAVEVIQEIDNKPLTTMVNPGFTLAAKEKEAKEAPQLKESTKSEIQEIHEFSNVALTKKEFNALPKEERLIVQKTEKACQKAVFEDIKATNPELAEAIIKGKNTSLRAMNALTLQKVFKTAPGTINKKKGKLSEDEMEDIIKKDVYQEYTEE